MSARILVVDDIPTNVKLLEARLTAEYFDVLTANDGPSALALAASEAPDLILLDVMMPGMDGLEVCRCLKADSATRHIPVVMVTALTDVGDRVRGLEAGADDFLSKPVNEVALFARVRSLVRLKMLTDELRTRQATSGEAELLEQAEEPEGAGGSILVIDANVRSGSRMKEYLENAGYDALLCTSKDSALQICQTDRFDLIITAIEIAGEDGLRLCSQFRSREATRYVPILMVLEDMDLQRLAKGLDLGVTDYVVKPVDRNELEARVRTQIRRRRYHDRLRSVLDRSVSMAFTDGLTGIYNRRYMSAHLDRKLMEIAETGKPVSIMLFDIDHFKRVNDTHGHAIGDEVLKAVTDHVSESVRETDLLARYGGEEFVLVMPATDVEIALKVADRIRERLSHQKIPAGPDGSDVIVTISAGVASTFDPLETPDALLKRADEALYAAKQNGRNLVFGVNGPATPDAKRAARAAVGD
ncbi:PleD family two-component system response regulator [Algihabitans albus]|uniref:PleD family two-component system response regulator n=1 Tax=Algihabitans albus TaxID=2164067 RepID=UPI000E5D51B6|nr:PleD family two-component system response regulator [Algihabitans albus]